MHTRLSRLLTTTCLLATAMLPLAKADAAAIYATTQASYGGGQGVKLWELSLGAGPAGSQANGYASLADPSANDYFYGQFDQIFVVGDKVYGTTQASYGGGQGVKIWEISLGAGPAGSQANGYASLADPSANDYFYGQFDQIFVVGDKVYGTTQASYGGGQGVKIWEISLGAGPAGSQANGYASLADPSANDYFYGQFDQIFVVGDKVYGTTQASYGGGQGVKIWEISLGAGPAGSQANGYASLADPSANDYFYGQFDQIFVVGDKVYGTTQASYGGGQGVKLWEISLGAGPSGSQANGYASLADPSANDYFYGFFDQIFVVNDSVSPPPPGDPVPLPATAWLLVPGLVASAVAARRARQRRV